MQWPSFVRDDIVYENPLSMIISKIFGNWLADKADAFILAFNESLPDLTALVVMLCGLMAMVTPKPYKWFTRAILVLWAGMALIML